MQLTEEEEAIKLSLMENEPLSSEILDPMLSEWWLKEPMRWVPPYTGVVFLTAFNALCSEWPNYSLICTYKSALLHLSKLHVKTSMELLKTLMPKTHPRAFQQHLLRFETGIQALARFSGPQMILVHICS